MEEKIKILHEIYRLDSQKCTNDTDFDRNTVGSEAYGETGYYSFDNLINKYKEHFNDKTVFYDLGSGCGKIVFHVGIMCDVKKSCGIEFSKNRHNNSIKTLEKYNYENIIFINDNILNVDFSDATIIYLDNTLFPINITNQIYDKIPKDCLVFSRQSFKGSKINNELKQIINVGTNYGTSNLHVMIKK
jgi:hypothetical protein